VLDDCGYFIGRRDVEALSIELRDASSAENPRQLV